jgi:hypothetical protein
MINILFHGLLKTDDNYENKVLKVNILLKYNCLN